MAEKISIGCIQIRPSSTEEKNSFGNCISSIAKDTDTIKDVDISATSDFASTGEDVKVADVIETPCIELDPVNPNSSSYMTVVIHNFGYVYVLYYGFATLHASILSRWRSY